YPGGPTPYGDIPILQGRGNTPGGPTLAPPGPGFPGGMPPGPMPYLEPMRTPTPAVPPPPPAGPGGLGSSRRTNEGYIVPQPPSLMQPTGQSGGQGNLAPPTIQPAAPPVGTGISPFANLPPYPWSIQPPPMQPPPPQQPLVPLP